MPQSAAAVHRNVPVDAAKTAAIFGTLLIHASAAGGFVGGVGSFQWTANLFWNTLIRCAVPVFFLCSGALLLSPEKEVTIRTVWRRYIPRIAMALFFWAAVYALWPLLQLKRATGVLEAAAIRQALADLLLFRHKSHLYYLHIILLVYAVLPVTRLLAAKADRRLMAYALGLWFLLGSVLPLARQFPPLSVVGGIPAQYPISLTWGAVGYTLLGYVLSREAGRYRPRVFVLLYLAGFALTFGGTLWLSLRRGGLALPLLQGTAPGVCLQAAGIYGFCVSAFSGRQSCRWTETVSKASFCVYLVHLFFLDRLAERGLTAGNYPPLWAVPAEVLVLFAASFLVWLALRRVPVVNKYLI